VAPMATKQYDLAVKTGEYEKDGKTKSRYENVGAVFASKDGPYLLLKRCFNPAGIACKDGSDSIIVHCFKPNAQGR